VSFALIGKMRSGKDETAKLLSLFIPHVKIVAFGDMLKKQFHKEFPHIPKVPKPRNSEAFTPEQINQWKREGKPIIGYQEYGQMKRKENPDIWVNYLLEEIKRDQSKPYIVTDVRQMNEYNALKQLGFYMVRVEANEEIRIGRMRQNGEVVTGLNHETERMVDHFDVDYVLDNNTNDPDILKKKVHEMVMFFQYKSIVYVKESI
jgi:dephospho-CoA kinase